MIQIVIKSWFNATNLWVLSPFRKTIEDAAHPSLGRLIAISGFVLAAVLCITSCAPDTSRTNRPVSTTTSKSGSTAEPEKRTESSDSQVHAEESWFAIYANGQHVGYRHLVTRNDAPQSSDVAIRSWREEMGLVRGGRPLSLVVHSRWRQNKTGELLELDYREAVGSGKSQFLLRQGPQEWTINSHNAEPLAILLPQGVRGPAGVEDVLASGEFEPESTPIDLFVPSLQQAARVHISVHEAEKTELIHGEAMLERVEVQTTLADGTTLPTKLWVDDERRVIKERQTTLLTIEYFRTTKERAIPADDQQSIDLLNGFMIPLDQPLPAAETIEQATYRLTSRTGKLPPLETTPWQSVSSVNDREAIVTVIAEIPPGKATDSLEQSFEKYLASNSLVNFSSEDVTRICASIEMSSLTDRQRAYYLEAFVHDFVTEKSMDQVFAPASSVAQTRRGDCTEHAVLLAALCRKYKIPARAALGVVYVPSQQALGFHMWNEIWLEGRWIPFDATTSFGGQTADRIKLLTLALDAEQPRREILKLLPFIGTLDIALESTVARSP